MVAQSISSSRAVASVCPSVTTRMIERDELMAEIEGITEQLTKTRTTLWETQDMLRVSEEKAKKLEMHVTELVAERNRDAAKVKQIQEDNTRCLEEEAKIRESLELMKKVFTRNQLKSKDDQETIALLQEERDLLLEENNRLHNLAKQNEKASDSSIASQKNERLLSDALERTRQELKEYKKKQLQADSRIRKLKSKLLEERESNRKTKPQEQQQPGLFDHLECDAMQFADRIEDRDEVDTNVVTRALLDEDLEESLTREFMQKFNCGGLKTVKKIDCASFNDEVAGNAYPLFGFGRRPQGSLE